MVCTVNTNPNLDELADLQYCWNNLQKEKHYSKRDQGGRPVMVKDAIPQKVVVNLVGIEGNIA